MLELTFYFHTKKDVVGLFRERGVPGGSPERLEESRGSACTPKWVFN